MTKSIVGQVVAIALIGLGSLVLCVGLIVLLGLALEPQWDVPATAAAVLICVAGGGLVVGGIRVRRGSIRRSKVEKESVKWARNIIERPSLFAIVDVETTGFGKNDEIVQIAAIDPAGKELLNSLVRPFRARINKRAQDVHGIKMADLAGAPSWVDLTPALEAALAGRTLVAYNAKYDARLVKQTSDICGGMVISNRWECAMLAYAEFVGEWNAKRGEWKWHKLPGAQHGALGDCRAALEVIRHMARG